MFLEKIRNIISAICACKIKKKTNVTVKLRTESKTWVSICLMVKKFQNLKNFQK